MRLTNVSHVRLTKAVTRRRDFRWAVAKHREAAKAVQHRRKVREPVQRHPELREADQRCQEIRGGRHICPGERHIHCGTHKKPSKYVEAVIFVRRSVCVTVIKVILEQICFGST